MNGLFDESPERGERFAASSTPSSPQADSGTSGSHGSLAAGRPRGGLVALVLVTAALVALIAGALLGHRWWSPSSGPAAGRSSSGSGIVATGSAVDVSAIAAKVDPSLVDVNTNMSYQGAKGAATGIVLSANGEVLTNNHVVEGATGISVTDIGNGKTYSATVVGYDPSKDVAVLQLKNASGLPTASIGNSTSASLGEAVLGLGNAGGAGGTPSAASGSITALHQSISAADDFTNSSEQLSDLIETNANIEPGDSGGPLVNSAGQVIGMDTAGSQSGYFSFQGSAASQAYAIPINTALAVAKEIEAGQGSTTVHVGATGFIGIGVEPTQSASPGFGAYPGFGYGYGYGGSGQTTTVNGLQVTNVVSGTPAAKAGLVVGDVITSFNGQTVTTPAGLTDQLLLLHPGAQVKIVWTDTNGTSHTSTIALASGPAS